jgi:hypothetical protein
MVWDDLTHFFSLIANIVSFVAMAMSFYAVPQEAGWTERVVFELFGVGALGTVGQLAMTRGYMGGNPAIKHDKSMAWGWIAALSKARSAIKNFSITKRYRQRTTGIR